MPVLDLLVVGGGPVGLATALYAERAGLSVAVAERRSGPVDKACGEGLMPGAVEALRDLGVRPPGRPFHGIRYTDAKHSVEARFRAGEGLGVRRTALHASLSDAITARGVPVLHRGVDAVVQDRDRVRVADLEARYVAAADGLHSPLRRSVGLSTPVGGPARYGLRRHFATSPWSDLVEVHWSDDAEAYVTPVADDLVGVAVLSSRREPFEAQLRRFPELMSRLPEEAATPVRGAGPLRQRATARVAGRVLLVGDAAGYVDALTGEGIAIGLASARALVDAVRRDSPERYERSWRAATRRYRWITESVVFARTRRPTARLIVPAAARLPRVFETAVAALAR